MHLVLLIVAVVCSLICVGASVTALFLSWLNLVKVVALQQMILGALNASAQDDDAA